MPNNQFIYQLHVDQPLLLSFFILNNIFVYLSSHQQNTSLHKRQRNSEQLQINADNEFQLCNVANKRESIIV